MQDGVPQPVLLLEFEAVSPLPPAVALLPPSAPAPAVGLPVAMLATVVDPPAAVTALANAVCEPAGPSFATVCAIMEPVSVPADAAAWPSAAPMRLGDRDANEGEARRAEVMEAAAAAPKVLIAFNATCAIAASRAAVFAAGVGNACAFTIAIALATLDWMTEA